MSIFVPVAVLATSLGLPADPDAVERPPVDEALLQEVVAGLAAIRRAAESLSSEARREQTIVSPGGTRPPNVTQGRIEFVRGGGHFRFLMTGDDGAAACFGRNDDYTYFVNRTAADAEWALRGVGEADGPDLGRTLFLRGLDVQFVPWAVNGWPLAEVLTSPAAAVTRCEADEAGATISFSFEEDRFESTALDLWGAPTGRGVRIEYTIEFLREQGWAVGGGRFRAESRDIDGTFSLEYGGSSAAGLPRLRRYSESTSNPAGFEQTLTAEFARYAVGSPEPRGFYLTALSVPEPPGVVPPSEGDPGPDDTAEAGGAGIAATPPPASTAADPVPVPPSRAPWLLAAGVGCGAAGAMLWRARRRRRRSA